MGNTEHALWIQAENIKMIYMLYYVSTSASNFQDLMYSYNIMYMVNYVAWTLKLINRKPCKFAITGFTNIQRGSKHIGFFPYVILLQIYLISYPHCAHTRINIYVYVIIITTYSLLLGWKNLDGNKEIQNCKSQWYIIEIRPLGMLRATT